MSDKNHIQSNHCPRPAMSNWQVFTVWTLRIIIGSVFIISGLTKAIDVWGFIYKIEEYVAVWNLPWWRSLSFTVAAGLSVVEFVSGFMLVIGAFRKSVVWWLLILMTFMLGLSAYIFFADPVSDCGCFGDFIILSNAQTFAKNIIIYIGLIILAKYNIKAGTLYSPYIQWIPLVACSVYIIIIGLVGYNVQPLIDFRSFPVGESLIREDDINDLTSTTFIYEKNGTKSEFTLENLPDSTWIFVDVSSKESENGFHSKTDFVIIDNGIDIAPDIIVSEGDQVILVVPEPDRADISYTPTLNEIYENVTDAGGDMVCLIAGDDTAINFWEDISLADYPIFQAEATILKELSRGVMSLVGLHDGKIAWKRTVTSLSIDESAYGQPTGVISVMINHGTRTLFVLTCLLIGFLVLIGLPGWIAFFIKMKKHFLRKE